jgi:hypothetical protein
MLAALGLSSISSWMYVVYARAGHRIKLAVTILVVFCARQRTSGTLQASVIQVLTDWISVIKLLIVAAAAEQPPAARSGSR